MHLNRREFHGSLVRLSAGALISPRLFARPFANDPDNITELYKRAVVMDSLCSPFGHLNASPSPELLGAVRQSGITAINYTISERTFDGTLENFALLEALVEKYPDAFAIVRKHSEIASAK